MNSWLLSKTNAAFFAFILPLAGSAAMAFLIVTGKGDMKDFNFLIPYLLIVPVLFASGFLASFKSIFRIEDKGEDMQYARFGLLLSFLFSFCYTISLIPILTTI